MFTTFYEGENRYTFIGSDPVSFTFSSLPNKAKKQILFFTFFIGYKTDYFLPKQAQKSRSVLSLGLLGRVNKTRIIAKFLRTDVVI